MKKIRILFLAAVGLVLSIIGLTLLVDKKNAGYVWLSIEGLLLFIFYVITFRWMLRSTSILPKRRVFWTTAIICLPVIANIIYVIMHDASIHMQIPKDRF